MSSLTVRQTVMDFLENQSSESIVDMTAQYEDLRKMLTDEGVQPDAPWLGVEFVGDEEIPVQLAATNTQGQYREYGLIQLHVCAQAMIGVGSSLISRGEVLRDMFRGARIDGKVVVESVSPMSTGPGATLEFEGGYVSGTISVGYYYDKNL